MIRVIAMIMLLESSLFAVGNCDGSGNCYVSLLATGTGSGADWTNACTDFTGACDVTSSAMRGTTIWVGGSPGQPIGPSYTAKSFSAPDSGTTPITIIAADAQNHGTNTGWNKLSAQAVVSFTGPLAISTDYWVFNGQFRARMRYTTESNGGGTYHDQFYGYHMQVNNPTNASGALQISGSNVTIRYMYIQGSAVTAPLAVGVYGQNLADNGIYYAPGVTNEYVGYSWIGFTGADSVKASSGSNFIFEYDMFTKNHMGTTTLASSAISIGDLTNLIVRYNHFHNITGQGILTDANVDANAFTPNWYFYGNDIFWDTTIHGGSTAYGLGGIVVMPGETLNGGIINVYNNTMAGINITGCGTTEPCSSIALNLTGSTTGSCGAHTQNCIGASAPVGTVLNNLWWNPYAATNFVAPTNAQWTPTGDYGQGICASTGCTNNGVFITRGPNDINTLGGNPFKSFNAVMGTVAWYNFNLVPVANTAAGVLPTGAGINPPGCNALLNCEINDPNYVTLGANGTIQRGAFQINSRTLTGITIGPPPGTGYGVHVGSTLQLTPQCTWSAAPTSDNCPDGTTPFIKQWTTNDVTVVTMSSSGVITGVSPHNAFVSLGYGGLTTGNLTGIVVTDGQGTRPVATLPTGIVRTGSPMAFGGFDTTAFDASFPTVYSDPCPTGVGCKRWTPTDSTTLQNAIVNSQPGDTIVLQAGTTYTLGAGTGAVGFFLLPARPNPSSKWTYIISSNMGSLPPQGTRVSPNDAVNMPTIVQTVSNGNGFFRADTNSDHWWIAGINMYGNPSGTPNPTAPPAVGWAMTSTGLTVETATAKMPDSITLDRCYVHTAYNFNILSGINNGSEQPVPVTFNASHFAALDNYIQLAVKIQTQSNNNLTATHGPVKLINNFFSGLGEDVILGGSGGYSNAFVASDIYVKNNTFWKDPQWRVPGFTVVLNSNYQIENNLELKQCNRCLIDGNILQNSWASGQGGGGFVMNTSTAITGPNNVINDVTFSNNILTGQLAPIAATEIGSTGEGCDDTISPCQYPGEARRLNVFNNLAIQGYQGPPGGRGTADFTIVGSIWRLAADWIWQHNTLVGPYLTDHLYCEKSIMMTNNNSSELPPTQNMWLLDNVLCRPVLATNTSAIGTPMLTTAMGDPSTVPLATRFSGNVMQYFTAQSDPAGATWPANNTYTASNFTYNSPTTGDYTLVTPVQPASDGAPQSGISYSVIMAHQHPALGNCSISGTVGGSGYNVSITGAATLTVQSNANGAYSIPNLAAGNYTVTPYMSGYSFTPPSISVTNSTCVTTGVNFNGTQLPTYTISGTVAGAILSGVTVKMTLTNGGTTTTDTSGNYSFAGQVPGYYVIAPSFTGYTFSPASATVHILNTGGNVTVPVFTATATGPSYSISGTVSTAGGGLSGVTLNLSGNGIAESITDGATGTYSFTGLPNGVYTITPSRLNYSFSPASLSATVNNANVTGINFTGTALLISSTISGTITGRVISGVTLTLSGGATTTTTSSGAGTYAFSNLANGTYTVTPSLSGYFFSPGSLSITVNSANVPNQNFVSSIATIASIGHIGPAAAVARTTKKSNKPK